MGGRTISSTVAVLGFFVWTCLQGFSWAAGHGGDHDGDKNETMSDSDKSFTGRLLALEPELIALIGMGTMILLLTVTIAVIICVLSPNRSAGRQADNWAKHENGLPAAYTEDKQNVPNGEGALDY